MFVLNVQIISWLKIWDMMLSQYNLYAHDVRNFDQNKTISNLYFSHSRSYIEIENGFIVS
jgi:hypothetical protein